MTVKLNYNKFPTTLEILQCVDCAKLIKNKSNSRCSKHRGVFKNDSVRMRK